MSVEDLLYLDEAMQPHCSMPSAEEVSVVSLEHMSPEFHHCVVVVLVVKSSHHQSPSLTL